MANDQNKAGKFGYSTGGTSGIEGHVNTSDKTFLETDGDLGVGVSDHIAITTSGEIKYLP